MAKQNNPHLDTKSFEINLQVFNSQTLPQLIPSAQRPPSREIIRNGVKSVTETSGLTYVFGTLTQSAAPASVRLTLKLLGPKSWSQDIEVTTVKEAKSYFLLPVLIPSISTWEKGSPIRAEIQRIIPIQE